MRLLLATALTLASACVTRTVYVVDDNPRNDAAASPREAARPAPPPVEPEAVPPEAPPPEETPSAVGSVDDFYAPLSPYGQWVDYPAYGQVWVPNQAVVGAGFRPYTYGHWEYTEYGWTWVDHSPFGWATGHYGRWFYDGAYGWVWVPGTTWAPAWVAWRTGGAYAGWAPLPPGAEFGGAYNVYDTSWVFVPYGSLGVAYVGSALIVGPGYQTCFVETYPAYDTVVVYGNTYYRGPDEGVVERDGGNVIHRPARDIDREHPVTRPPESVARTRPSSSSTGASRPRGASREAPRSADRSSEPESPRHDRREARDDAAPMPPRDDARRAVPTVPDRRGDARRALPDDAGRSSRDARPDVDELNPSAPGRAVEVQPRPIETPEPSPFERGPSSRAPATPQPRFDNDRGPSAIAPRAPGLARPDDVTPRFDNTPSAPRSDNGPAPIAPRVVPPQQQRSAPPATAAQPSAPPDSQDQGQQSSSSKKKSSSKSSDKGKSSK
jgi:hypothetical protein